MALWIKRKICFGEMIKELEDIFSMSKSKKWEIKLDSVWYKRAGDMLEELIDSYTIIEDDINFVEAYILIDITEYYGMLDKLFAS